MTALLLGSTGSAGLTTAVVIFCLVAAGGCLALAIWLAASNEVKAARKLIKDAQDDQRRKGIAGSPTGFLDPEALAKLAAAIERLDPAGRFLLFAFAFAAAAAFTAGVSSLG